MPLKVVVDKIEDVPEAFRGEYTEKDGKFHLGLEGAEDTDGLKRALASERKMKADLEKKVRKWEALGKTDEEIAALLTEHEEAERKKAEADGDHAKILKQHQDKWDKDRKELEDELSASRSSERNAIIENRVLTSLTKAEATDEGIDLLPDRLSTRIKFETVDGKRVIKIMQADGETPMAGSGKDGEATFDDLVKEAKDKWPSLFKGSGQAGSGKDPASKGNGSSNGGKTITRAEWAKKTPAEKAKIMETGSLTVVD